MAIINPMVEKFNSTSTVYTYHHGDIIIGRGIRPIENASPVMAEALLFNICREGKMQFRYEGKIIQLKKGEVFVFPKNASIDDFLFSADFKCDFMAVRDSMINDLFAKVDNAAQITSYIYEQPIVGLSEEQWYSMSGIFDVIHHALETGAYENSPKVLKRFVEAFGSVIADAINQLCLDNHQPVVGIHGDQIVREFMILQQDVTAANRTVADIANSLNVTSRYLAAIVRKSTGKTPMEIMTETKVQEIANRLQYGTESIKEIAYALNFENLSSFGKYVRKHLGMSPTEYRSNYAKCT